MECLGSRVDSPVSWIPRGVLRRFYLLTRTFTRGTRRGETTYATVEQEGEAEGWFISTQQDSVLHRTEDPPSSPFHLRR